MAKLAEVFRENPALVYVVVGAVTTLAAALEQHISQQTILRN